MPFEKPMNIGGGAPRCPPDDRSASGARASLGVAPRESAIAKSGGRVAPQGPQGHPVGVRGAAFRRPTPPPARRGALRPYAGARAACLHRRPRPQSAGETASSKVRRRNHATSLRPSPTKSPSSCGRIPGSGCPRCLPPTAFPVGARHRGHAGFCRCRPVRRCR